MECLSLTNQKFFLEKNARASLHGKQRGLNVFDKNTNFYYQSVSVQKQKVSGRIVREGQHCMKTQVVNYRPRGVCCTRISYEIRDNRLFNVRFTGGCNGNGQGLARLLDGMLTSEASKRLRGISCEAKSTSCPDQLARSLTCS
jgi:uncharacterized protein (TIGR03905 family)